ncbi:hypothetical protein QCD61_22330 [Pseudomonas viciae]|uniref:Uncharacterized protein n=1 Tax=Pseudomonas viciae TaxID=2505979 RepID=A0ABY8PB53_9PSED|nr:hypothetical protein [Pseudomonas viciae]WGO92411.1 hypothetical protein QCD61_22330 [Pseudomonas viciae]
MKCLSTAGRGMVSVLFAALLAGLSTANAATREITAVFRPDPAKPMDNKFVNTTLVSGFCHTFPAQCAAEGLFSMLVRGLDFESSGPIQPDQPDIRQGAMVTIPGGWRTMQIVNSATGESEELSVRIAGWGGGYTLSESVIDIVGGGGSIYEGHEKLWVGGNWRRAPQPCRATSVSNHFGFTGFEFFWITPEQDVTCAKQTKYLIPGFKYSQMNLAYELRTPNPLKMSTGHYTGSITYSVGPGQDFDMGDIMLPNDSALTLNFNLEVQHTLKVEVPPGGNRVDLEPQEGWQAWLNSGRKPTRLFRDQRFHISASSRFKMALECQYVSGNTCAVAEPDTGHAVPVDVSVSLPEGLTDAAGQPVNRRRLLRDGSGTELFQPSFYVDRRSGTLHFEVGRSQVEEMLDSGAKAYSGNVTVIWDSEV